MKKKSLFYALIVSTLFAGCLASCGSKSSAASSSIGETTKVPTSTESSLSKKYNLDDNELSKNVYNEFKKSFSDKTYDDFLLNGTKSSTDEEISFQYSSSTITLNLDGSFKSKIIIIDNSENDYIL